MMTVEPSLMMGRVIPDNLPSKTQTADTLRFSHYPFVPTTVDRLPDAPNIALVAIWGMIASKGDARDGKES